MRNDDAYERHIQKETSRIVAQWERAYREKHPSEPPKPAFDKFDKRVTLEALVNHIERERRLTTAQSTIDAFWYVVRNHDDAYLQSWLDRHPDDAGHLLGLLAKEIGK